MLYSAAEVEWIC